MSQNLNGLALAGFLTTGLITGAAAMAKDEPPVATGEFQFLLVGKRIGEERFRVFKKKKEYRLESTATFYWPKPTAQHYEWKLDRSLQPDKLDYDLREGGKVITVELRKKGKNWRSEIKGKNVKKVKEDMGLRQSAEIDFGSLLFQWITFRHLKLAEGEKKDVEVIVLEAPKPKVARIERTYTRLPNGEVQAPVQGSVVASIFEVTQSESSYRLWLDPTGFPIRTERETPDGPLEVRLVRFDKDPRAW